MSESLHHVHIFASDIDATVAWWRDMLGGVVVYDGDFRRRPQRIHARRRGRVEHL